VGGIPAFAGMTVRPKAIGGSVFREMKFHKTIQLTITHAFTVVGAREGIALAVRT